MSEPRWIIASSAKLGHASLNSVRGRGDSGKRPAACRNEPQGGPRLLGIAWQNGINFINSANVHGIHHGSARSTSASGSTIMTARTSSSRRRCTSRSTAGATPGRRTVAWVATTFVHAYKGRWTASTPTTLTSTTSAAGTNTPPSKRRCRRLTNSPQGQGPLPRRVEDGRQATHEYALKERR